MQPVEEILNHQEAALPEPTESMSGPNKLGDRDLNPKGDNPKRLSTRSGVLGLAAGVGLVVLMVVGIISRSQKAQQNGIQVRSNVDSATRYAETITHDLETKKKIDDDARARKATESGDVSDLDVTPSISVDDGKSPAVPPLKLTRIGGKGEAAGRVPDLNQSGSLTQPSAPGSLQAGRKSAEEMVREEQYKEEMAAMKAPTSASGQNGSASPVVNGIASALGGIASNPVLQALASHATTPIPTSDQAAVPIAVPTQAAADPNMQDRKEAFLSQMGPQDVYLHSTRQPQLSRYEIKAGWDIPAALEQAINTDIPGQIRALVRENVYDSATGKFLLIPQGSRLVGTYDSHVAYGQSRVQIQWSRLLFPDGSSISLGGMIGQDAQGNAGFYDKVDHHYVRLAGMALLTSAFSAGIGIAANQGQTASPYGYPSNQQVAANALAQQMGQMGMEITRRNMDVQPTIKISIGYRFNVRVNKDIVFEAPYVAE